MSRYLANMRLEVVSVLIFATLTTAQPVVDTHLGPVQGQLVETHYGINVTSWHGIPYAASTAGENRWTLPVDPAPYDGTFVADTLGDSCIQSEQGWIWITHPGWRRYDEDCLNLDVYAPENLQPDVAYPVMVFFHGGAFQTGANIQYPGHFYAARDVILVVPNYRLSIFGFISTDDSVAPGNYGLYDQRLAMQWVQTNIANFGGDPERVTIFGQSAGGASAGHHMISPGSQGLFSQVIEQSGTDISFWAVNWPASQPETYGQGVAEEVGCPTDDSQTQIDCMRQINEWELHNASNPLECNPGHFCLGFAPVVDGPGGFIPDIPIEMRKRGEFAKVPVMTGYLKDDGALYTLAYIPEASEGGFTREEFNYHLREDLLGFWTPQFDDKMNEDAYQAMNYFYTPWPYLNDTELNREAFNVMITDAGMGMPSDRTARFHSEEDIDTYQFLFAYRSDDSYGGLLNGSEWLGTFHSAELPYVFGYPLIGLSQEVRRDTGILIDIIPYNEADIEYAEFVTDLWANFAKFGNPTPEPITPPFGNEPVTWDAYNTETFNTFYMDREDNIKNIGDYSQKGLAFWREYFSYIIERDFYYTASSNDETSKRPTFNTQQYQEAEQEIIEMFLSNQETEQN